MLEKQHTISYHELTTKTALSGDDRALLLEAEKARSGAYAPYSNFHVGAAVKLVNGVIQIGNNQENASFPVGVCGERVALFAAGAQYPDVPVDTIAISVASIPNSPAAAAAPCGLCRQAIAEYEMRHNRPIRLVLGGETDTIYVFERAGELLPLAFDAKFLQQNNK